MQQSVYYNTECQTLPFSVNQIRLLCVAAAAFWRIPQGCNTIWIILAVCTLFGIADDPYILKRDHTLIHEHYFIIFSMFFFAKFHPVCEIFILCRG